MTSEPAGRPPSRRRAPGRGRSRPAARPARSRSSRRRRPPTRWSPSAPATARPRGWSWWPSTRPPAGAGSTARGRPRRAPRSPSRCCSGRPCRSRRGRGCRCWPGYAVDKALEAAGFEASVKWPNDVLARRPQGGRDPGRAGRDADAGPAAVVGIGLNVGMTADELPVPEATSLAVARRRRGARPHRPAVSLLASLWEAYTAWQEGGDLAGMRLAESYAAACATIGREVRVDLPVGRGARPAPRPASTRRPAAGRARRRDAPWSAGDVVHVRAAVAGRADR